MLCESSTILKCDEVSDNKYLQCECGFVPGSDRSDILKKGPVLEENVQDSLIYSNILDRRSLLIDIMSFILMEGFKIKMKLWTPEIFIGNRNN